MPIEINWAIVDAGTGYRFNITHRPRLRPF